MPPQGGFVGECPSTRITHERLLSRVDAPVALEGVQLGELLPALIAAVGPLPWVERRKQVAARSLGPLFPVCETWNPQHLHPCKPKSRSLRGQSAQALHLYQKWPESVPGVCTPSAEMTAKRTRAAGA